MFRRLLPLALPLLLATCSDGDPSISSPQAVRKMLDSLGGPQVDGVEKTMLDNAQAAEAEGNLARAGSFYMQMHDRAPEKREWEIALADIQRRTNGCNDALEHYEALAKKDPKDVEALEGKALCLMNIGESKEASQVLTQVLQIDPARWRALNAVGVLFAGKGKVPEAIAYFEKAAEVDGTQLAVINNLGLAYLLDKRYDRAIETFQRAEKRLPSKSPDKPRIDMNLALAYALSGNMDEAQKFAAPHVSEAGLYNNLGFFAKLAKDERLARDYLNMALSKSPTYYKKAWENLDRVQRGTKGDLVPNDHGVKIENDPHAHAARAAASGKAANMRKPLEVIAPEKPDPEELNLPSVPPSTPAGDASSGITPPNVVEKPDSPAIETP